MKRDRSLALPAALAMLTSSGALLRPAPAGAQLPFAPAASSGQTVSPAYEGWYRNPDGSFSLSFGYFNRNHEEVVRVPVGPDNRIELQDASRTPIPGGVAPDQGQPTEFHPERHWGVFTVRVPADFGDKRVVWTLRTRDKSWSIPGGLDLRWQIDALEGEAGSGNTPPVLRFEGGPTGQGPAGATLGSLDARVGVPLELTVWATDDGRSSGGVSGPRRVESPVALAWFGHQGPAPVRFSEQEPEASQPEGKATTTVTFDVPGDYLLRVRVNDASGVSSAGHAQCCWTNGFVKVRVTG